MGSAASPARSTAAAGKAPGGRKLERGSRGRGRPAAPHAGSRRARPGPGRVLSRPFCCGGPRPAPAEAGGLPEPAASKYSDSRASGPPASLRRPPRDPASRSPRPPPPAPGLETLRLSGPRTPRPAGAPQLPSRPCLPGPRPAREGPVPAAPAAGTGRSGPARPLSPQAAALPTSSSASRPRAPAPAPARAPHSLRPRRCWQAKANDDRAAPRLMGRAPSHASRRGRTAVPAGGGGDGGGGGLAPSGPCCVGAGRACAASG